MERVHRLVQTATQSAENNQLVLGRASLLDVLEGMHTLLQISRVLRGPMEDFDALDQ